jgi:uncharacterized membrane protein HdeD (DUF308 family)
MNPNKFFNKWWLMLARGVLLIFFSYFLFTQPARLISTAAAIAGFIALLAGTISIIGYFLAGKNEKTRVELLSGFFSCIAGLFFLSGTVLSYQLVNYFFAAYMIVNAIMLVNTGWHLKVEIKWWWYSVLLLVYTLFVVYFIISDTRFLQIPVPVFAGVQFFTDGIFTIIFAFVVRKLQHDYNQTINQIRNQQID